MNTTGPVHENYNFYIDLNKGMRLILTEIFFSGSRRYRKIHSTHV